jgi:hypoxanthine-DNA glycosylase
MKRGYPKPMSPRKHAFPPVIDAHTRVLVLGSLPGERSLAEQRYYAHPQNQFWRLISAAIQRDIAALDYDARLAALLEAHVGLWDVVASAERKGSLDATIREPEVRDIAALAASLPELRAIAFNGGAALKHGLRQLGQNASPLAIIALPSSSPLHTISFERKCPAWLEIGDYLT